MLYPLSGSHGMQPFWRQADDLASCLECCRREALQLGSPLDRAVTEKGVLQLLFDARFLSNALAGSRPSAPEQAAQPNGQPGQHPSWSQAGAAGGAAQKQRKKAFAELERSLQVGQCLSIAEHLGLLECMGAQSNPAHSCHGDSQLNIIENHASGIPVLHGAWKFQAHMPSVHILAGLHITLRSFDACCHGAGSSGIISRGCYNSGISFSMHCDTAVQERLDPIDWATYEPYVWANEAAVRPRMAVLFGLLTRLGQQGMEPVSRGAPPGEANVMAVAKQVPSCCRRPSCMQHHAMMT